MLCKMYFLYYTHQHTRNTQHDKIIWFRNICNVLVVQLSSPKVY